MDLESLTRPLEHLMGNCQDFEEEESLLQYMGATMGVKVDRTPKCHCELAGEGVEYSWGCAKNTYRRIALKHKRGKENFRKAVRECLSRQNVLTTERIRTFSRRARAYVCAYYSMWTEKQREQEQTAVEATATSSPVSVTSDPVNIEKLVKRFKTHRCALDFDHAFCEAVVIDLTGDDQREERRQQQRQRQ
jgi:hypothetical protein